MDKVVHFEIPAGDMERAKKFYSKIFGWKINDVPNMEYSIVHTVEVDAKNMPKEPGAINGGIMTNANVKTPVIVISVKSVDSYHKKIEKAGGKIVMPTTKVADMGLYARFQDTEGNIIGIWQNLM